MGISTYLADKVLDHTLGVSPYTPATDFYVALYTSNPGEDNSGAEVLGNDYARELITFGASSDSEISNDDTVEFAVATDTWGIVTHFGLFDAATDGNLLYFGELDHPRPVELNNQLILEPGELKVKFVKED